MQLSIAPSEEIYLRFDVKDIRKSQFQEVLPNDLIAIEQTWPPVDNSHLNRVILFTYKVPAEDRRFGFEALIKEITAGKRVILHKLTDPAPCDLRVWPRIRLDLLPNVRAFCRDKEIQVIDVSGGGTHVILPKDDGDAPAMGTIINLKFVFEKGKVVISGKIIRKWQDPCRRNHAAIEFCGSHDINQFIY
jgi:hypothetical protein